MPIISVSHLRKEFAVLRHQRGALGAVRNLFTRERRSVKAVDNVSFSIECGELVGYPGPNGASKSTTFKMLTGILVPSGGGLAVDTAEDYPEVPVAGAQVAAREVRRVTYRFARDAVSASELISRLSAQYRMLDLSVREPEIEATVRRIYQEELLEG